VTIKDVEILSEGIRDASDKDLADSIGRCRCHSGGDEQNNCRIIWFEHGKPDQWYHILPGIIGFCFVFIIPLVIMEVGTLPVFLGVIAGQIVMSIVWNACYENMPVNSIRVAGALLVVWKK
jgi:hypothetical protein